MLIFPNILPNIRHTQLIESLDPKREVRTSNRTGEVRSISASTCKIHRSIEQQQQAKQITCYLASIIYIYLYLEQQAN